LNSHKVQKIHRKFKRRNCFSAANLVFSNSMISMKAYAKINLGLRIIRKRDDGYHDIETVFHRVNLFDELILSPSSKISLTCNSCDLPFGEENLCVRAARLLQEKSNLDDGVHIHLHKNIPVGAGLAGGSSDAAAMLAGLNDLWNLNLAPLQLSHFALMLGSDVPYFMGNGSAYAMGRGELLEYFSLDLPYWIVIVYPNLHVSTAWAYQQLHIEHSSAQREVIRMKDVLTELLRSPRQLATFLPNDFEPIVFRAHPEVAHVRKLLYELGAEFAQMSGSGSSVYGLFTHEKDAEHAQEKLNKNHQTFITPPHFKP
jgi:4-diphosphocytidyl-2-C-methyl-D-erythritol kinase